MKLLATYREIEDLVQIGAYARGSNAETDCAIEFKPRIDGLLQQSVDEAEPFEQSRESGSAGVGDGDSAAWIRRCQAAGG